MKKKNYATVQAMVLNLLFIGSFLYLLSSCVSMAPINSSFESAKTLSKGQIECLGNYSTYYLKHNDTPTSASGIDKVNYNYGFRFGYGISERFDIKFRYERIIPVLEKDKKELDGINYFALSPRSGILKDYITGSCDFGLYKRNFKDGTSQNKSFITPNNFFISPGFTFSYPSGKYFDLSLSAKLTYIPGDLAMYWGINLGCGISTDTDKWILRPEFGFMKGGFWLTTDTCLTGGIAIILKLNTVK